MPCAALYDAPVTCCHPADAGSSMPCVPRFAQATCWFRSRFVVQEVVNVNDAAPDESATADAPAPVAQSSGSHKGDATPSALPKGQHCTACCCMDCCGFAKHVVAALLCVAAPVDVTTIAVSVAPSNMHRKQSRPISCGPRSCWLCLVSPTGSYRLAEMLLICGRMSGAMRQALPCRESCPGSCRPSPVTLSTHACSAACFPTTPFCRPPQYAGHLQ